MKKKKINSNNLLLLITIVLFFVMYAAGCIVYADKGFTRFQTFLNILINNAGLICITAGMTCVMLTGGIDISVGSVVAMDCMILAVGIEQWGWSSPVLMLFILAIGIVFGVVQGFCISYLEIQPFIVTMAGMFFARGMTAVICKEQVSIVSDKIFTTLSSYKISLPFWGISEQERNYAVSLSSCNGCGSADRSTCYLSDAEIYTFRTQHLRSGRKPAVSNFDGT